LNKRYDFLVYGQDKFKLSRQELAKACDMALSSKSLAHGQLSNEVIDALVAQSLFERSGRSLRFGRKLIFINRITTTQLLSIANKVSQAYARIIGDELIKLKSFIPLIKTNNYRPDWTDVAHSIVAGLIIDLGVRSEMLSAGIIIEQPDDFWVWTFEGGTGSRNSFGVQVWIAQNSPGVFDHLWHKGMRRVSDLKIDGADVTLMQDIFERRGEGSILTNAQHERAVKLAFYGLLAKPGKEYVVNVPVLAGSAGKAICFEITRISATILTQAVVPAMSEAEKVFRTAGLTRIGDNHRHAFARLLLECSIDQVIERGLVPEFPVLAKNNWGAWLTLNDCVSDLRIGRM
jgi:hypothetical protein